MDKQKNILNMAVIALIIIALIALVYLVGETYAIWVETQGEYKYLEYEIIDENPSVKYQIYMPVNSEGQIIKGNLDIIERSYALEDSQSLSQIEGYALIGWQGGISLTRVEIPMIYAMTVNGEVLEKPVVKVMVISKYSDYVFQGNDIITELVIGANVTEIESGVFSNMSRLTHLNFMGSGEIIIKDYAFLNCPLLHTIQRGNRIIIGNEQRIFS